MNLQEILESFELSEDQITKINSAVDSVIESKLSGQTDQIKELEDNLTKAQGDLASADEELTPVREAAKKDKLTSLMPDNADTEKSEDIISLANISDDDDDDSIASKLSDVVSSRDYLQKKSTDDLEAKKEIKTEGKSEEKKPLEAPKGVK